MISLIKEMRDHKQLLYSVVFATFVFGLLAHSYAYFNVFFNHDSLDIYHNNTFSMRDSHGRFMVRFYAYLTGGLTVPFVHGILSLIFSSLSSYFLVLILEIKDKYLQMAVCAICVTSPILTISNATYIFFSDVYMLSLLLSVFAVYIFQRTNFLYAIPFLIFSLGLYQSYIQVTAILLIIVFVKDILEAKSAKELCFFCIKSIFLLLASMIIYYIIIKHFNSHELSSYRSYSSIGEYGDVSIFTLMKDTMFWPAYYLFGGTFAFSTKLFDQFFLIKHLNRLLCVIVFVQLCFLIYVYKIKRLHGVVLLLTLALFPIAGGFMLILAKEHPGILTYYSICMFFVLVVFCLQKYKNMMDMGQGVPKFMVTMYTPMRYIVLICLFINVYSNVILANQMYVYKELEYTSTLSFMTRLIEKIEGHAEYIHNETEIAFVGQTSRNKSYFTKKIQKLYDPYHIAPKGTVTHNRTYLCYFENILGIAIKYADLSRVETLKKRSDVQAMPEFPHKDSIKMIDGTLVVVLSQS